jgi:hypothetical protein
LLLDFPVLHFEVLAGRQHAALGRRPGAELAAARAAVEIRVGFSGDHLLHAAFDADLLVERDPVKAQRGERILDQFPPLATLVVSEKPEAALVDRAHQHHPRRRPPVGVGCRQRRGYGINLMRPSPLRRAEELGNRMAARHAPILALCP